MSDASCGRDKSDQLLIEGWKQGKTECYEALYHKYSRPIYWFIYYMVRENEAVKDLTQDVFIKLYHSAHLCRKTDKFSSWLYKIAKNLTLNYLRDEKHHRQAMPLEIASPEGVKEIENILEDKQALPDEAAATQEQLALFEEVFRQLSEHDRQLITMCVINELSHKEAAEILNCSVLNVTVGLYRARKRLVELIRANAKKLGES